MSRSPRRRRTPTPLAASAAVAAVLILATALTSGGCKGAEPSELFAKSDGAAPGDSLEGDALAPGAPGAPTGGQDPADGSIDAGSQSIDCQGAACEVGREICCRRGATGSYKYACEATSSRACKAVGGGEAPLSFVCDDAADCEALGNAKSVCCGEYTLDSQSRPLVQSVACLPRDECLRPQSRVVLCGDGDSTVCPSGTRCEVSQTALPGIRICVSTG